MVHNLMREMLWAKPPQTIEMYTIKKHMQDYPQFKNTQITKMTRTELSELKSSEWAKMLSDGHPRKVNKSSSRQVIQNQEQVQVKMKN